MCAQLTEPTERHPVFHKGLNDITGLSAENHPAQILGPGGMEIPIRSTDQSNPIHRIVTVTSFDTAVNITGFPVMPRTRNE